MTHFDNVRWTRLTFHQQCVLSVLVILRITESLTDSSSAAYPPRPPSVSLADSTASHRTPPSHFLQRQAWSFEAVLYHGVFFSEPCTPPNFSSAFSSEKYSTPYLFLHAALDLVTCRCDQPEEIDEGQHLVYRWQLFDFRVESTSKVDTHV
ncbi:hypothetical protein OE88DRAFT_22370 [Heliocybe sulcata]|uniref:Uncharacterized protein n=1 Tax=Heliocybe sulcata TaxID=5364 RepID=A0A5C3NJ18_9AGAM|nr:hypothetical protein OE88DRAFT_22370 [Heliocybe sulcata]